MDNFTGFRCTDSPPLEDDMEGVRKTGFRTFRKVHE